MKKEDILQSKESEPFEYFDFYKQDLIDAKVPKWKATYISQRICNKMRKQKACIFSLYIKGKKFKIGTKTDECGYLVQETFETRDGDQIYYQYYFD